ncbi:L,D-transpeptidase family protein [Sulfurimonas sp.]|uniref:L,D-transpeptidase family protein n=1 Tax=Sulfurimonas sp. TaxID=2022749 RepID=UPI0025FF67C7|nr:L,D-transpeptidase family protein [Sulfurimonas sp.]MDD5157359.1 L,D-transpeptidase family protein [Sulfurimonas sp.]
MVKSFLIIAFVQMFLYASSQIILVVSENIDSKKAVLMSFENSKEVFAPFDVNIGLNGLAYGVGEIEIGQEQDEPLKYEGDKKAPLGIFLLDSLFGYEENNQSKMPYQKSDKELICIDDTDSEQYNKIIRVDFTKPENIPKSFEYMRRDDGQYEFGVVVLHNKEQFKGRGSCIFLHVQASQNAPTSGCTSMSLENMKKIVGWLDKSKNPILIQITKSRLDEILELFPELKGYAGFTKKED